MAECLILGQAGIGKTSAVEELLRRRRLAYDADDKHRVPGLSGWFDMQGRPCDYQNDPKWRANHQFLWDMTIVRGLITGRGRNQPLYFAGTAQNDLQAVQFFTHTVVLDADVDTYCKRRVSVGRKTPYPRGDIDGYRAWLTGVLPGLRVAWRALGATILDTTGLTISQVVDCLTTIAEG
jgi:hypothetical protein